VTLRILKRVLEHPLSAGLGVDAPQTTELRRRIIETKPFLRRLYEDWYAEIVAALPPPPGLVLELGSGAGFLSRFVPDLITSDIMPVTGMAVALDASALPFGSGGLRAVVMTDVFHHLSACRQFLREAARCVRPGGRVVMIEPWVTRWSRFVFTTLHHEPFDPDARTWEFASSGPLSGANGALPWIVFDRDRDTFEREFPEWRIRAVRSFMPFRYLLSGGVSLRSLMPAWSYGFWRSVERVLGPMNPHAAMFAVIVLDRVGGTASPDSARLGGLH
jgi:SAM-dependent methyltransferase